jgi:hypothetical protein
VTSQKKPWESITIKNWRHFEDLVEMLPYREWVFRGQYDCAWEIKSSLYRLFEDFQLIFHAFKNRSRRFAKNEHERHIIRNFQASAHLYINNVPTDEGDLLEWCSIMQHHGAPTRLIDVTFSPFIASYFALESGHNDCCVYAFKHNFFTEIDKKEFELENYHTLIFDNEEDKAKEAFFVPYEPKRTNLRLMAQQGLFLVPSTNYQTFDDIVSVYQTNNDACIKYVIPAALRYEGIKFLRRLNITSSALFPGIDGFSKSLRNQVIDTAKHLKRLDLK